jgi:hypothetical protein
MIVDGAGVSAHIVFTSALTFGKREVMEQANAFDFWSLARAWFERIAAAIFLPLRCDQFPPPLLCQDRGKSLKPHIVVDGDNVVQGSLYFGNEIRHLPIYVAIAQRED